MRVTDNWRGLFAWDRVSLVQVKKGKKAELAAKAGYINMHV